MQRLSGMSSGFSVLQAMVLTSYKMFNFRNKHIGQSTYTSKLAQPLNFQSSKSNSILESLYHAANDTSSEIVQRWPRQTAMITLLNRLRERCLRCTNIVMDDFFWQTLFVVTAWTLSIEGGHFYWHTMIRHIPGARDSTKYIGLAWDFRA